jgi:hypothetical protein
MLTRREVIAAGAAAALATAIPGGAAAAPTEPLKTIFRLENGQWVRRRMSEFQVGNYMKYVNSEGDEPVYVRIEKAPHWIEADQEWGCAVLDIQLDGIPKHLLAAS